MLSAINALTQHIDIRVVYGGVFLMSTLCADTALAEARFSSPRSLETTQLPRCEDLDCHTKGGTKKRISLQPTNNTRESLYILTLSLYRERSHEESTSLDQDLSWTDMLWFR